MEMNYLAIIVSGVAAWVIGAIWYQNFSFGKAWQKELGFTDEYLKEGNMALTFGGSLLLMIIMAFGLSFVIGSHAPEAMDFKHGAFHGLMTGLFFVAPTLGINYLYQRKSLKLYLIDVIYMVLFMAVIGAIQGAWT